MVVVPLFPKTESYTLPQQQKYRGVYNHGRRTERLNKPGDLVIQPFEGYIGDD